VLVVALLVGVLGLAAVIVGSYLRYVAAPRAIGSTVTFQPPPDAIGHGTVPLPRAPHLRAVVTGESPRRRRPLRQLLLRRPSTSVLLFLACFVAYGVIAGVLVLHYGSIVGDAQSRVANAWYVLFSRDPHLAAIGFVWNPLPSVFYLPLLLLKGLWPALAQRAFASNLISALCAAGCVVQFRQLLEELRIDKAVSWTLTALLALNPMFVYYAANGMSEAIYLLFLIWACRYLAQWLRTFRVRPLVIAGVMFALGYLTRYETAAAAFVAMLTVTIVSYFRALGTRRARRRLALVETIVFILPFAAAFLGWALVSYVIKGDAFIQLNPNAGNALLIRAAGGITAHKLGGISLPVFGGEQLLAFAPLLPILFAWASLRFVIRRDPRVLVAAPFVGALVFTYVVFITGDLFPWFRYYLPAVPASLMLVAVVVPSPTRAVSRGGRGASPVIAVTVALAIGVAGLVTTSLAMWDRRLGSVDRGALEWIANGGPQNAGERSEKLRVASAQTIAAELDRLHLASGDVVVDTNTPCVSLVLMNLQHPHIFVIPSDRDWEQRLADPVIFHSHYLLIPPRLGTQFDVDNVRRSYPGLYESGGSLAKLVKEFHTASCPKFRLYRVLHSPDLGHGGTVVN
jgi:hypothetical protein